MVASAVPRVVIVSRPTEYASLLARHGTREQARFFLESRGLSLDEAAGRDEAQSRALHAILSHIPDGWRRARVERADLDRFLFGSRDIVVTVGSSGLVANVAKYLDGQPVIGVNPDPSVRAGIVAAHPPARVPQLLLAVEAERARLELRTMAQAVLDDGQSILALNELFIGHASHQSARYRLCCGTGEERQSSSGIVVSTGTGATGWSRSIQLERHSELRLPGVDEQRLAWFVREPWPSPTYGTSATEGAIGGTETLDVISELHEGGVIFADGIESDRLDFRWGVRARIGIARQRLRLVV